MDTREIICIGCPLGCPIQVGLENGQVTGVTGNTCKRGEEYARKEATCPTRIVTTTVPVEGGRLAAVSVKTERDVPKEKVFDIIKSLKGVKVQAPIRIGAVVASNAAGTGVDIIATKNVT